MDRQTGPVLHTPLAESQTSLSPPRSSAAPSAMSSSTSQFEPRSWVGIINLARLRAIQNILKESKLETDIHLAGWIENNYFNPPVKSHEESRRIETREAFTLLFKAYQRAKFLTNNMMDDKWPFYTTDWKPMTQKAVKRNGLPSGGLHATVKQDPDMNLVPAMKGTGREELPGADSSTTEDPKSEQDRTATTSSDDTSPGVTLSGAQTETHKEQLETLEEKRQREQGLKVLFSYLRDGPTEADPSLHSLTAFSDPVVTNLDYRPSRGGKRKAPPGVKDPEGTASPKKPKPSPRGGGSHGRGRGRGGGKGGGKNRAGTTSHEAEQNDVQDTQSARATELVEEDLESDSQHRPQPPAPTRTLRSRIRKGEGPLIANHTQEQANDHAIKKQPSSSTRVDTKSSSPEVTEQLLIRPNEHGTTQSSSATTSNSSEEWDDDELCLAAIRRTNPNAGSNSVIKAHNETEGIEQHQETIIDSNNPHIGSKTLSNTPEEVKDEKPHQSSTRRTNLTRGSSRGTTYQLNTTLIPTPSVTPSPNMDIPMQSIKDIGSLTTPLQQTSDGHSSASRKGVQQNIEFFARVPTSSGMLDIKLPSSSVKDRIAEDLEAYRRWKKGEGSGMDLGFETFVKVVQFAKKA